MRMIVMAAAAAALVLGAQEAAAHAFLKRAMPAVGSTVMQAPTQVAIDFTEDVEPRFSTIVVTNAQGERVDTGAPHILGGQARLAVALKPLPPGTYRVNWHATSVDTHKTEGTFSFTVEPK
jgi:hypothetical protein